MNLWTEFEEPQRKIFIQTINSEKKANHIDSIS